MQVRLVSKRSDLQETLQVLQELYTYSTCNVVLLLHRCSPVQSKSKTLAKSTLDSRVVAAASRICKSLQHPLQNASSHGQCRGSAGLQGLNGPARVLQSCLAKSCILVLPCSGFEITRHLPGCTRSSQQSRFRGLQLCKVLCWRVRP